LIDFLPFTRPSHVRESEALEARRVGIDILEKRKVRNAEREKKGQRRTHLIVVHSLRSNRNTTPRWDGDSVGESELFESLSGRGIYRRS
jgi:hypothetical protein